MIFRRRHQSARVVAPPSEQERQITEGLAYLQRATAKEVMTPRVDVVALSAPVRLDDVVQAVRRSGRSHYPVHDGDLDRLEGVLFVKDLFTIDDDNVPPDTARGDLDVTGRVREPYVVPESRSALAILSDMRRGRRGFAVVVDEYGGFAGVLTINDLVSELVGDLRDEYDRAAVPGAARIDSRRHLVDGSLAASDVRSEVGFELPEGEYVTLAGFLLDALGHVPEEGEGVVRDGWRFTVVEMDRRRIAKVVVESPSASISG
jgi:CBS domain containing-hemolysin-like protein